MADLIALVPDYVCQSFDDAPPGHRYRLYLQFWQHNFAPTQKDKLQALKSACKLPKHTKDLMTALAKRSQAADSDTTCYVEAKSTSPFSTGLGWEHPNENGFAFLDPYGLPYLPGSGVKGVLRLAAEQLALERLLPMGEGSSEGTPQWNMADVWTLFGFDANSAIFDRSTGNPMRETWLSRRDELIGEPALERFVGMIKGKQDPADFLQQLDQREFRNEIHTQGCLRFWDVIPELAGDKLEVDILNPHYGDYYHKGGTPHDAGQPVPVFFLTVPPGSTFRFRVDLLAPRRLSEAQRTSWKTLLNAAFEYTFDWLGFGAKTAVGYGAMRPNLPKAARTQPATETVWENAVVHYSVSTRDMTITHEGQKLIHRESKTLFDELGSKGRQEKAKTGQLKANVKVRIAPEQSLELVEILAPPKNG